MDSYIIVSSKNNESFNVGSYFYVKLPQDIIRKFEDGKGWRIGISDVQLSTKDIDIGNIIILCNICDNSFVFDCHEQLLGIYSNDKVIEMYVPIIKMQQFINFSVLVLETKKPASHIDLGNLILTLHLKYTGF
jgi:hypothetical protein